ncbi:hypothetical protein V9T40_001539 [Parthenolecanium corni]|uniref:Transcriptional coactivator p15 (PC4) C-terminal domain-containing protein n=1 Tax=Parthenolecanium corni TaxID=536013 RepID=A0AAN9TMH3_9HEMI
MPKHKKSSSSDSDSDSGPDDRNPPAKKSAPNKSKSSDSKTDDKLGWHLGNNRFANVSDFKGRIFVNIREYYEKDGELKPGKKGISLTAKQWQEFKEHIDDIDSKVTELA